MKDEIDLEQMRESDLREMVKEYQAKIEKLEANILMQPVGSLSKIAYKCPVCIGVGMLPNGFYNMTGTGVTTDASPEKCRTCDGLGMVWG